MKKNETDSAFSRHMGNLTPQPPSLQGKGEKFKASLLRGERFGERFSNCENSKLGFVRQLEKIVQGIYSRSLYIVGAQHCCAPTHPPNSCKREALYQKRLFFITLPIVAIASLISINTAQAQEVSADGTLSTTVTKSADGLNFTINNGNQAGGNLFHSFKEFSVPNNGSAVFQNGLDVQNIIGRVTGGLRSDINGLIKAQGSANLFLINPAGILFGPNARLQIGGSFFGSTANSLLFDGGVEFSATDLQAPPLLTVNIPNGLKFRGNPANITNQSVGADINNNPGFGLQVPSGKTLALVGGDINFNSGKIVAPGAKVELGGLKAAGTVGLNNDGSLSFPEGVARANVTLKGDTNSVSLIRTDTFGQGNPGNINITTGSLFVTDGSQLLASTYGNGDAGKVTINATDIVSFDGTDSRGFPSAAFSNVETGGEGNGGEINITAGSLSLTNGGLLGTFVRGAFGTNPAGNGNAGNIKLNVSNDIKIAGVNKTGTQSGIFSDVESDATGNAGNIDIQAGSISITDNAELITKNASDGLGGNITLNARDKIEISNSNVTSTSNNDQRSPSLFNFLKITATQGSIFLNNAEINATNSGIGFAGDVVLNARDQISINQSTISSRGLDGRILIGKNYDETYSPKIVSFDGSTLDTSNDSIFGSQYENKKTNAGEIFIDALESISLVNGSKILSDTDRLGNAGNITLRTEKGDISLADSLIRSRVLSTGIGKAGDINITARSLKVTEGTQLSASTFGNGDAGSITINATGLVSFDGEDKQGFVSAAFSNVEAGAVGNGGDINITAGSLELINGAQLNSFVRKASGTNLAGNGNAGNVNLNITNDVNISGRSRKRFESGIFSDVATDATGDGGRIEIQAGTLRVTDGARLSTENASDGLAGNIILNARDKVEISNSKVTNTSNNDDTNLRFFNLLKIAATEGSIFLNNAEISTTNFGIGFAGDVVLNARDNISINQSKISSQGRDGYILIGKNEFYQDAIYSPKEIRLNGSTLSATNASVTVNEDEQINAGEILIDALGIVSLVNGSKIETSTTRFGDAGNITLKAGSLSINDDSELSTSTSSFGNAGNVSVQVDDSVTLANTSSISSDVFGGGVGIGGDVSIKGRSLTLTNGSQIGATVFRARNGFPGGIGRAGSIDINATDFVNISGVYSGNTPGRLISPSGLFVSADLGSIPIGSQAAGNITVTTGNFRVADGAVVNALTFNSGNAGNITINAKTFTATGGGQVFATTRSSGNAGNINLNISDRITLSGSNPQLYNRKLEAADRAGESREIVSSQGPASGIFANTGSNSTGRGGNLTVNTRELRVQDGATITVSSPQAQAGNLTINARTVRLNRGSLTAETAITSPGEEGANIKLQGLDLLSLRNGSLISAKATGDTANGGNITINAANGFVIAAPGDSDIIASASQGRGGNIKITSQSIFGLAERRAIPGNRTNDIDASSQVGLSGTVDINTPETDPTQGLVELPETVEDPTQKVAQNPCRQGASSEFVVTGRGGLPPNPNQTLNSDNTRVDLVEAVAMKSGGVREVRSGGIKKNASVPKPIVPAQGWILNDKGEVVLTAYNPNNTNLQRDSRTPTACTPR
jgi:filamentous hemagglutinin family protein